MARPDELIAGNCYFTVGFHDTNLLYPYISTLKFLRCDIDETGQRLWLFDDPGLLDGDSDGHEEVVGMNDDQLYQVLDFPGLVRELNSIAIDHPLSPIPPSAGQLVGAVPSSLKENIQNFLSEAQSPSLTITILFTDDGFSIGRGDKGAVEFTFFPHPRRDPAEEAAIRNLFRGLGREPHVDYLADRGRTRVLGFPGPDELDELTSLAERVLREVYRMRDGDSLAYSFHRESTA